MKVAVVGCGAVGSFYGAKLACAGLDVHFLLRSDYEKVREAGVRIESRNGDFLVHPRCAREPSEIGRADLVLIGLKTTANDQFSTLLPPLVGPGTMVLTLQNGLGNEDELANLFGTEAVLGALCFVCLNRIAPGVVRHLDHGDLILGEFSGPSLPRTRALGEAWSRAGVLCRVTEDLARAHWEKLCWNIPFNGLGVASAAGYESVVAGHWSTGRLVGPCLPTDELLRDGRWERLVRELMAEVILAANRQGYAVSEELGSQMIARTRSMGAYRASTLLDFESRRPLELESIFFEPLRRAKAAGCDAPRLTALCAVLSDLDSALARGAS